MCKRYRSIPRSWVSLRNQGFDTKNETRVSELTSVPFALSSTLVIHRRIVGGKPVQTILHARRSG